MGRHFGLELLALHSIGDVDAMDPTRNGGAMGKDHSGDGDAAGESSTVEVTAMPQLRVLLGNASSDSAWVQVLLSACQQGSCSQPLPKSQSDDRVIY